MTVSNGQLKVGKRNLLRTKITHEHSHAHYVLNAESPITNMVTVRKSVYICQISSRENTSMRSK
jgi:hypothetical protein